MPPCYKFEPFLTQTQTEKIKCSYYHHVKKYKSSEFDPTIVSSWFVGYLSLSKK